MADEELDLVDIYEAAVNKVLREYLADRLSEDIANQITLEFCRRVSQTSNI